MTGILPIYKSSGMTSHSVTSIIKRKTNEKCGHGGTLDPMATGVLPILIGKATRLSDFLSEDKEYEAEILLGLKTDTGDITGRETEKKEVPDFSVRDIKEALLNFSGEIMQTPPMYSAIKKDGVKLYELARKGEKADIEPRKVIIYRLELLSFDEERKILKISVSCSKGTYIRSLAEDIGEKLNVPATLFSLLRTVSAGIKLNQCISLEKAEELPKNELEEYILSPEKYFMFLPTLQLPDDAVKYYLNGGKILLNRCGYNENSDMFRVYNSGFLGLGETVTAEEGQAVKSVWTDKI